MSKAMQPGRRGKGGRGGKGGKGADGGYGGYRGAAADGSVSGQLQMALDTLRPEPFVALFTLSTGLAQQLHTELGGGGVDALNARLAQWCGAHGRLAEAMACCVHAAGETAKGNAPAASDAMLAAVKNLDAYFDDVDERNCAKPAWMIPFLGPVFNSARYAAKAAEQAEGKRGERMSALAAALRETVKRLAKDDRARGTGLLVSVNSVAKMSFYTNNMGFIRPVIQMRKVQDKACIEAASIAQRVTFHYFSGRLAMLDQNFAKAEECLTTAFNLCHTGYRKNCMRILLFLVTVKLVQGKFPKPHLLRAYGLHDIFQPIVSAMQTGRVSQFDAHMEQYASFFAKLGIYVVLHRARVMCYLTLIRRVHHARCLLRPNDSDYASRIKLPALMEAFKATNDGQDISQEEVECALVCLIANTQVKAYIALTHETIVLRKEGAFPKFPQIA